MSVVLRPSETWTARLSAANGVYAPTPLTDETEGFGLSHVRSVAREAEHATGWSLDLDRVKGAVELRGAARAGPPGRCGGIAEGQLGAPFGALPARKWSS